MSKRKEMERGNIKGKYEGFLKFIVNGSKPIRNPSIYHNTRKKIVTGKISKLLISYFYL